MYVYIPFTKNVTYTKEESAGPALTAASKNPTIIPPAPRGWFLTFVIIAVMLGKLAARPSMEYNNNNILFQIVVYNIHRGIFKL